MADDALQRLRKTHAISTVGAVASIVINKPKNFVYDISSIVVEYNSKTKDCKIRCAEMPDSIIRGMLKFQEYGIEKFISIIEEHLETFCMGREPDIPMPFEIALLTKDAGARAPGPVLRPFELPSDYAFPMNANITPNLKCESMKSNVFLFTCRSIDVQVACQRCGTVDAIPETGACKRCSNTLGLTYIPKYDPNYLGFLGLTGCAYVCMNPVKYQYSCSECNANYETPLIAVGSAYVFKCYICFCEIKIKIESIFFIQKKDYKLKIGNELPDKGTCRHYKKSQRWFRFECCSGLYPCDVCHDEDNSHPAQEAKRMVCGLCSKEQSVKKDCECGMTLRKAHTQFWEGGRGNREKSTMSKKDSKKYHR